MSGTVVARSPSAALRAKLPHPVVDADAHVLEGEFVLRDYIKQVGGAKMLERFEDSRKTKRTTPHRRMFWAAPSGKFTLDRATAMLPRLYRERLGEAGVDFAVVYTTYGLDVMQMQDDELRPAVCRAVRVRRRWICRTPALAATTRSVRSALRRRSASPPSTPAPMRPRLMRKLSRTALPENPF